MAQLSKWKSYRFASLHRHALPVFVWLGAVGILFWLFSQRSQQVELIGIAQGEVRQIASLIDGRLEIVPVRQFEKVRKGQTLAVLSDDRIYAQWATASAEVARLRAEMVAAEDRLKAERDLQNSENIIDSRRFAINIEQKRLDRLELMTDIETDKVMLEGLGMKLDIVRELYSKKAATVFEQQIAQSDFESLAKKIEENKKVLEQLNLDIHQAQQRQDVLVRQIPVTPELDKALEPFRKAIDVQERVIAELAVEKSLLVLSSPIDGTVSEVLRGAGETVLRGELILTLTTIQPSEVIAYVPADKIRRIKEGMPIELTRWGRPKMVSKKSNVVAVGPSVLEMPQRLWANPTMPQWGWPVQISIPDDFKVLSGEIVGIRGM
jgi:HlyD family secretion protein